MTRYIQGSYDRGKAPKPKKPRDLPKSGKYTVKDLTAKGVKSGLWEKKDEQ